MLTNLQQQALVMAISLNLGSVKENPMCECLLGIFIFTEGMN